MKDRLGIEGIGVVYCPTEEMLADFSTKPLQGSLFRKRKAVIMGHAHVDSLQRPTSDSAQEPVGEQVQMENKKEINGPASNGTTTGVAQVQSPHNNPRKAEEMKNKCPPPDQESSEPQNAEDEWKIVNYRKPSHRSVRFESARGANKAPLTLTK